MYGGRSEHKSHQSNGIVRIKLSAQLTADNSARTPRFSFPRPLGQFEFIVSIC